jgi:hypothetical protein
MNKKSLLFLLFGTALMAFPVLTSSLFTIETDASDFFKGVGFALIVGSLIEGKRLMTRH